MLFSNTIPRLSTRAVVFKRLEWHLSRRTSSICNRALREFIFSELPRRRRTFVLHSFTTHTETFTCRINSQFSSQSHVQTFTSSTQFSFLHASKPTVVNDPAPLSPAKTFPSGNRKCTRNWNPCAHRYNSRAGRNWDHQRRNRLFTHTDQ